jgi:hypothetical protein
MARRTPAAKPASGATAARVRRSRSKAATEATRALRAQVDALAAKVAVAASDTRDSTRWALRYLEACRPLSALPPAPLSSADQLKLANAQADEMAGVVRAVLDGLHLSDADFRRGIDIAIEELRKASAQGWEPL